MITIVHSTLLASLRQWLVFLCLISVCTKLVIVSVCTKLVIVRVVVVSRNKYGDMFPRLYFLKRAFGVMRAEYSVPTSNNNGSCVPHYSRVFGVWTFE